MNLLVDTESYWQHAATTEMVTVVTWYWTTHLGMEDAGVLPGSTGEASGIRARNGPAADSRPPARLAGCGSHDSVVGAPINLWEQAGVGSYSRQETA